MSKFCALDDEAEDLEDEEPVETQTDPSTLEFIKDAMDAGFTIKQLSRAEQALGSGNVLSSGDCHLSKTIISKMIQRKLVGEPWHGPLPPPHVSPPITLADFITKATLDLWFSWWFGLVISTAEFVGEVKSGKERCGFKKFEF